MTGLPLRAILPDFLRKDYSPDVYKRQHMFCLGEEIVYCSNFAPLYDIPEECATGTSNGALTYYLYERSLVEPERENLFLQGEHMERPSRILSRLTVQDGVVRVRIGGQAVMSLAGEMDL